MKKTIILFSVAFMGMVACNNQSSDPVEKADSTNEVKEEEKPSVIQTDNNTTEFLVKAADGGMTEVNVSNLAEQKATSAGVKRFAAMMTHDHTEANSKVKALAAARNVTLPTGPSEEHQKDASKLSEKTGKDFDKDYMDMMVSDHKSTIDLFEKTAKDSKDEEVKTFITNTLPTLKAHLDSAEAIRKAIKK